MIQGQHQCAASGYFAQRIHRRINLHHAMLETAEALLSVSRWFALSSPSRLGVLLSQ